jgi:hypothetical protein
MEHAANAYSSRHSQEQRVITTLGAQYEGVEVSRVEGQRMANIYSTAFQKVAPKY